MQNSADIATLKTLFGEGIQLKKKGNLSLAIEKLTKALQLNPNSIPVLNHLAAIYESKKEFDRAIIYLQQVLEFQPNNGMAYARLAKAMMGQKNIQGAIANYGKAISLQQELPVWVYTGFGNALSKDEQLDKAISNYQKAIKLSPDNPNLYQRLAQLYSQNDQWDIAIAKYHQALQFSPESVLILNQLAEIYKQLYLKQDQGELNQNEKLQEIIEIYQKVIEYNPDKAEGYFGMGHVLIAHKKWEEAIECFAETLKRNPHWTQVYQSLAYALKQQGNQNLRDIRLCYEKSIIPQAIIRKIYDFKPQDLITSLEPSNELKYTEIEQVEPFLPQKTEKNFVVTLTNGQACRNSVSNPRSAVISSNHKLVEEVSGANSQLIFYANKNNLIQPLEFDETVAYLLGSGSNYFHWILQVIPQICLLRHVGIDTDTIAKFAFFRLPINLPFQKETLGLLGIPRSKIIQTFKNPNIKAKKLIVTSPINIAPPRKLACELVRSEFLNQKSLESIDKSNRIYISRKNSSSRKIINENQLITLLTNFGFKVVSLESMTFLQQVGLFSQTEIIVAPHGAGLTNLIFCQPGVKVIEIFAKSYPYMCYQQICSYYNLNYYSFIGEDVDNPTAKRKKRDMHVNVNLNALLDLMKLAEVI